MKTTISILLISLFCLEAYALKYEQVKQLNFSEKVSTQITFAMDLKYADVDILTWDKDELEIDVEIIAGSNREKELMDIINSIHITFDTYAQHFQLSARFEDCNCRLASREVKVQIRLPKKLHLDLTNKYGRLKLNETLGNLTIDLRYGKMNLGVCEGERNHINIAYSKGCHIEKLPQASIKLSYSDMHIEKVDQLNLQSKYSDIKIKDINTLDSESAYGNLTIEEIDHLKINRFRYGRLSIEKLNTLFLINQFDYSKLNISVISKNFQSVTIHQSKYSELSIKNIPEVFRILLHTKYSQLTLRDDPLIITKLIDENNSKIVEGYRTSPSGGMISINAEYAGIVLQTK